VKSGPNLVLRRSTFVRMGKRPGFSFASPPKTWQSLPQHVHNSCYDEGMQIMGARLGVLVGGAILMGGCVAARIPAGKESLTPPGLELLRDSYHLSPVVKSNGFLFLSGVIGANGLRAAATAEEEFEIAWKQIASSLEHAGVSTSDIVEIVSYHTDPASLAAFAQMKDRFVSQPYPTWTAVGVSWLAVPGARAEIKVTARVP
jgi:enamine deaminase RidA (YjgF/YER057c/UK114 family)